MSLWFLASRRHHLLTGGMLAIGCLLLAAVCSLDSTEQDSLINTVNVRFIAAPAGGVFGTPAWLPRTGEIIVVFNPAGGSIRDYHLYAIKPDGSDLRPISLPNDPECEYTSQSRPYVLPDGRLAYLQECWVSQTRELPQEAINLMVFDPTTQSVQRLLPYYLPFNTKVYTFAPDLQVGLANVGVGLQERLYWLFPNRLELLDLPLERAGSPSWSPDGRLIAVDGAPDALGREGIERLELPRTLYLMSTDGKQLRPLVDHLRGNGASSWSPDGRWLVVPLDFENGERGLWLIEVATGKRYRLMDREDIGAAAWSPDGRSLAVPVGTLSRYISSTPGPVGLYIIDLPDLNQLVTPSGQ